MSGQQAGDEVRPFVREMADREDRLVFRFRPYATFATPPRHLHVNEEASELTHWGSSSVAWDAPDYVVGELR